LLTDAVSNNLYVILSGLLVFTMTPSVGLLEIGELGEEFSNVSLLKAMLITGIGFVVMAIIGFNTAFAPTIGSGLIGNPAYGPGVLLGSFTPNATGALSSTYWSMTPQYFGTGLTMGTYFLFETAFATVTLALVGVVVLKKVKLEVFALFAVLYFVLVWNLPAAWIWNPTGWLYALGMRDFAGGLVVHGAAGAAGLGILARVWAEERKKGLTESPKVTASISPVWLTLSILLLWVGWFGFNPGSVLAFDSAAVTVVMTTFLAASASFVSLMALSCWETKQNPGLLAMANGVLMGLIVITPLAGFVSPASAMVLGFISGPLYFFADRYFGTLKWFTDPVGLLPGHLTGGLFGVIMIGFFTQSTFATASGNASLPNGILFGGGLNAVHQLGIEVAGVVVVMAVVFALSYAAMYAIGKAFGGILTGS